MPLLQVFLWFGRRKGGTTCELRGYHVSGHRCGAGGAQERGEGDGSRGR